MDGIEKMIYQDMQQRRLTNFKLGLLYTRAIKIAESRTCFPFKNFFIVPKLKLKVVSAEEERQGHDWLEIWLNGKKVPKRLVFDPYAFLRHYWRDDLTKAFISYLDSVEPGTSKDKEKAKRIFKQLFGVEVIDI